MAVPFEAGSAVSESLRAAVPPSPGGLVLYTTDANPLCVAECLHTMESDGSNRQLVTTDFVKSWAWSPHGNYIAFDPSGSLEVMKLDGSDRSRVVTGGSPRGISWSPDGWTLAFGGSFSSDGPYPYDLYLVDRDGSNLRKLFGFPDSDDVDPSWSPDGSQLTFSSNQGGNRDIYVINADGTGLTNLTPGTRWDTSPEWSPVGNLIAFTGEVLEEGVYHPTDIYTIDPNGGVATNITNSSTNDGGPSWSPDGSSIAFHSYRDGDGEILRMNADGSNEVAVTSNDSSDYWPAWGPPLIGGLSGHISDQNGVPVPQGRVDLWAADGSFVDSYQASIASGAFATEQLAAGGYFALLYNGDDDFYMDYFPQWYADTPLLRGDLATPIVLSNGDVHGIDATLDLFFLDIWDSVFLEDIIWMQYSGVTQGCGDDLFCVDAPVTRGQMAAFLVRALALTDDGGGDLFVDDNESIFERDVDRLATAGITRGCNPPRNDMFCPDDNVTRGQMAAFLVRALGYTDDGGGDLFVDDNSSIFQSDVDRLATAGVTRGCNPPTNDRFCPSHLVTRGQMAAFLHRALG